MTLHAKFSPSAAHRWISCPGSIRLSEGIDSKPSEYAMEGTALHTVTEHCLREKLEADSFIGIALESMLTGFSPNEKSDWSMPMDEDHAEAVQYCVDEVKRITKEVGVQGGKLEVRVILNDNCWGTVDVLLFNSEWVIVIDHKFGRGKSVEAEGNSQLMIYFLGALKFIHENKLIDPIPKKAMLVILQPRIPNPTRIWETTVDEIKTWYVKSVKPAFEEAENGDAPCNPGEEQCQFCPANAVCTSRADYLLGVAEQEFKPYVVKEGDENLPALTTKSITEKMDGSIDFLTPQIAANILAYQGDFDNYFKRVGEYAIQHALDGGEIPGFKVVYGKSNRKWDKPDKAIELILKEDYKLNDPYTKKLLSPAQAEKKVGKDRKAELSELIIKPLGKKVLVSETDTREAIDMSGEEDMKEFTVTEAKPETVTSNTPEINIFEDDSSIGDIMNEFDENPPEEDRVEKVLKGSSSSMPSKRTKKYQLVMLGLKGGVPIKEAAESLFKGDSKQVEKGLRNLNERDGYTIILHANNSFTVKEAK